MRLFGPRRGSRYGGLTTYCHDYALVDRPGFYALKDDGRTLRKPLLRLVAVDDAPHDPEDGAFHFEVAGKRDPIARSGVPVTLEAHPVGESQVEVIQ